MARPAGGNLWIRGADVSLDAGRAWQGVSVVPPTGSAMAPKLGTAVARPGGGWLGTVVTMPGPTTVAETLAVSTDGLTSTRRTPRCGRCCT